MRPNTKIFREPWGNYIVGFDQCLSSRGSYLLVEIQEQDRLYSGTKRNRPWPSASLADLQHYQCFLISNPQIKMMITKLDINILR